VPERIRTQRGRGRDTQVHVLAVHHTYRHKTRLTKRCNHPDRHAHLRTPLCPLLKPPQLDASPQRRHHPRRPLYMLISTSQISLLHYTSTDYHLNSQHTQIIIVSRLSIFRYLVPYAKLNDAPNQRPTKVSIKITVNPEIEKHLLLMLLSNARAGERMKDKV
jgi:hypothetical protein